MNFFAWFSLLTSGVCLAIGLAVYFIDKKALLNKLFMAILAFNTYWAFCEFMLYQAGNLQEAIFWNKALFLWPFFSSLMLHFTLAFTENNLLTHKWTYAFLYLPPSIFATLDLATDLISAVPAKQFWGYAFVPADSIVCVVDGFWVSILALLSLMLCVAYYCRVTDVVKKQQAKFVAVGLGFPVVLSIITDSILPMTSVVFPSLENTSSFIFTGFIAYAMWRYDLFSLNPAVAAENIFSTVPDSLILVGLGGNIVQVNEAFLRKLGFTKKEVLGKPLWEMFSDEKGGNATFAELSRVEEVQNQETQFKTKTGELTVLFSGSIIKRKSGQKIGFACIVHDISARKQMEEKLVNSERFASIGQLAGMVGHDLRNPLSSMSGATYYLKTRCASKLDAKAMDMLSTIESSIDYSNKIVSDLLDYSREMKLDLETATPKKLVEASLSIVKTPVNIQVLDFSSDSFKLQVDRTKIYRVFTNIIKNAFEAMPNGGTLTIKNYKDKDMAIFTFNDTGTGLTPEALRNLWKPLFTTKAKGMGFGLAICKRVVEAHGGRIEVESAFGKGTTVTTALPIAQNST